MILFGINFNIYFAIYIKNWKSALKNEEARTYLGVIAAAILMITVNIYHIYGNVASAFRYSSFQVAAVITTTGFYTADFNLWPEFSKTILLVTMIIGACAGSTGGGMKESRILILCKSVKQEIKRILHPKAVTVVTVNGQKVGRETLHGVYVYSICYALILVSSVLIVSIDNYDFATSVSAVLTTLNNVGPGELKEFHRWDRLRISLSSPGCQNWYSVRICCWDGWKSSLVLSCLHRSSGNGNFKTKCWKNHR